MISRVAPESHLKSRNPPTWL